jgi:hypothetical protein
MQATLYLSNQTQNRVTAQPVKCYSPSPPTYEHCKAKESRKRQRQAPQLVLCKADIYLIELEAKGLVVAAAAAAPAAATVIPAASPPGLHRQLQLPAGNKERRMLQAGRQG